ncbi:RNA recognition motif 2-domain-containing protein [Ephemerocybe angulata]|uniref:RNA recognition motif 2-domain-containing protein n=1 Tax=Ephemerocybe angulata TaxID=980116 RepID=A0A8H6I7H2_9AGAR|nr:RNA recognition motif 2-domain-containing protein [Tulosesus angulatus]
MTPPPSPPSSTAKPDSASQKHLAFVESRPRRGGQSFRPPRKNRKSRMSYITPPLTPASSIKTTASVDSSVDTADTEDEFVCEGDLKDATRFVALGPFDKQADRNRLESAILEVLGGAVQGTEIPSGRPSDFVKVVDFHSLENDGQAVVVFHDLQHASATTRFLPGLNHSPLSPFLLPEEAGISVSYISPEDAGKKLSNPSLVGYMDGGFYVSVVPERPWDPTSTSGDINVRALKNYLKTLTLVREHPQNKTFRVEFCNVRDAMAAYETLNNQTVFGMTLSVYGRALPTAFNTPTPSPADNQPKENKNVDSTTIYSSRNHRFSAVSQFTGMSTPTAFTGPATPCPPQWEGEIRSEHPIGCANPDRNCNYCPSRRTPHSPIPVYHGPPTPSPTVMCSPPMQHMMSPPPMPPQAIPIDFAFPHQMYGYQPWAFEKPVPTLPPGPPSSPPRDASALSPHPFFRPDAVLAYGRGSKDAGTAAVWPLPWPDGMPLPRTACRWLLSRCLRALLRLSTAARRLATAPLLRHPLPTRSAACHLGTGSRSTRRRTWLRKTSSWSEGSRAGQDTRTTVMIKNIPNKMSDKDLIAYINKVCPRRIDFLYLRMDFQNGCNVGYAFVNFIEAQDLLKFATARLGEKWNMFSSEKVLQMSYCKLPPDLSTSRHRGKEALVEKFKNSCIMDERESWRPKIFYSFGPNQGLPEPFPAPTHIRRKERSSFNRGALYVPAMHTRNTLNSPLEWRGRTLSSWRSKGKPLWSRCLIPISKKSNVRHSIFYSFWAICVRVC